MLTSINSDREIHDSTRTDYPIKYTKQVVSEDQFVPLFTCVPYSGSSARHYILENSQVLPTYHALMLTGTPWLEYLIFTSMERVLLSYRLDLSNRYHTRASAVGITRNSLAAAENILDKITAERSNIIEAVTREVVGVTTSWIPHYLLAGPLRRAMPVSPPWSYKIKLTDHYTSASSNNLIEDSLSNNWAYAQPYGMYHMITRFGYIGKTIVDVDGLRKDDLYSLACVMIRAGKCPDMACAFITGKFDELDLSSNDIELWEDSRLADYLGPSLMKDYHQHYRVMMRNTLKVSIRQKDNLSKHLFDLSDTEDLTPIELQQLIKKRMEDAALAISVSRIQLFHDRFIV